MSENPKFFLLLFSSHFSLCPQGPCSHRDGRKIHWLFRPHPRDFIFFFLRSPLHSVVGLDFPPSSLAMSGGEVMGKVARKDGRPPSLPFIEILPAWRCIKTTSFHQFSSLSLWILCLWAHTCISISEWMLKKTNKPQTSKVSGLIKEGSFRPPSLRKITIFLIKKLLHIGLWNFKDGNFRKWIASAPNRCRLDLFLANLMCYIFSRHHSFGRLSNAT